MTNMVALMAKRKPGRPRKLPAAVRFDLMLSPETVAAAEQFRRQHGYNNLPDALREMLRRNAVAEGLLGKADSGK